MCEKTKNGIFIETNSNQSEIDIAFQAITNKIYGNADINYNVEEFLWENNNKKSSWVRLCLESQK